MLSNGDAALLALSTAALKRTAAPSASSASPRPRLDEGSRRRAVTPRPPALDASTALVQPKNKTARRRGELRQRQTPVAARREVLLTENTPRPQRRQDDWRGMEA